MATYPLVGGPYSGRIIASQLPHLEVLAPPSADELCMHMPNLEFQVQLLGRYVRRDVAIEWANGHFKVTAYVWDTLGQDETERQTLALFIAAAMQYTGKRVSAGADA